MPRASAETFVKVLYFEAFPPQAFCCVYHWLRSIGGEADGLSEMFGYRVNPGTMNSRLLSCRNRARSRQ